MPADHPEREMNIPAIGSPRDLTTRTPPRGPTASVGVLINDLTNPWFVELLSGLASTLHGAGFSPILADGRTDREVGVESIDTFLRLDVDGIVVVGSTPGDGGDHCGRRRHPGRTRWYP